MCVDAITATVDKKKRLPNVGLLIKKMGLPM
jgi:hypothetical protein